MDKNCDTKSGNDNGSGNVGFRVWRSDRRADWNKTTYYAINLKFTCGILLVAFEILALGLVVYEFRNTGLDNYLH
jgi:hypothetical protein